MAWTQIQTASAQSATATTITATFGSTPTSGNLLIASFGAVSDNTGLTLTSSGWTQLFDENPGSASEVWSQFWYKIAGVSEATTVTVTNTNGARSVLRVVEYSGNAASSPVDVYISNVTTSNPMYTALPADPTTSSTLAIMPFIWRNSSTSSLTAFSGHDSAAEVGSQVDTGTADTARMHIRVYEVLSTAEQPEDAHFGGAGTTLANAAVVHFKDATSAASTAIASGTGSTGAFVQGKGAASASSSTTIAATFTSTPTSGNLLVAIVGGSVATGVTPTITPASGWTQLGSYDYQDSDGSKVFTVATYYKVSAGTESGGQTWTFDSAQDKRAVMMAEFSGGSTTIDVTTYFNSHQGGENGTVGTGVLKFGSRRTTLIGDDITVVGFVGSTAGTSIVGNTTSPTNSFTLATGGAGVASMGAEIYYRFTGAAGAQSTQIENSALGAGSSLGYLTVGTFAFGVAAGSDHWGWSDGSGSHDSWQEVA